MGRCIVLLFAVLAVALPVFAQQGTGETTHIVPGASSPSADTTGGCTPTPQRPCPKICDQIFFDGAGAVPGGWCTIRTNDCTPLGGAPPACTTADMNNAGFVRAAGNTVTLNQYAPGSTREDATVLSVTVRTSDQFNGVLSSFLGADITAIPPVQETPMSAPPLPAPEPPLVPGPVLAPALGDQQSLGDSGSGGPRRTEEHPLWGPNISYDDETFGSSLQPDPVPGDLSPIRRAIDATAEVVENVVDRVENFFRAPMSGPLDLTSGENWGEDSPNDSGRPLDAQTWEEWERRLALQTVVDGQLLTMVDGARLDTLESQLEGLRNGYRSDSPVYQALDAALGCVRSGECTTYTDAMRRITNGLGIYGAPAHDFVDRYTNYLDNPDMLRRYVLPADLTTLTENRAMDDYIRLMTQANLEGVDTREIERLYRDLGQDAVIEQVRLAQQELREQYEADLLELAERDWNEVIRPQLLEEEAARALEEYTRTSQREESDMLERLRSIAFVADIERALEAASAEAARLADEAREAWRLFSEDESALSRSLSTLADSSAIPCTYPSGPNGYCLQINPETGMMRGPSGLWRTYDEVLAAQMVQMEDHWTALVDAENTWYAEQARIAAREEELRLTGQISTPIPFGRDSAVIDDASRTEVLSPTGTILAGQADRIERIDVIGHSSRAPGSGLQYNDYLSWQRAEAVAAELRLRPELQGVEIRVIGAGFRAPLDGVPLDAAAQQRVVIRPVYRAQ